MFAGLPGVSAPPPFGGNQRTVIIKADPERLRSYNITADELVAAIAQNNTIIPAGNIRMGNNSYITPSNSVVDNFKELENVVVKKVDKTTVLVRDLATVNNGADVTTGYALINGKRSVYIPVTKRADASTLDVVHSIRNALPEMQAAIPDDIKISYAFDQSGYVTNALQNLLIESLLGALLTGLMVGLFLKDLRSVLIVIVNIPLSMLTAVICLYLTGQTINIMTLGGLALAVGVLVDESTVTIENIHHHLELGKSTAVAIWDACREIAIPKLLILMSILAVFVPSLFMTGVPRSMFLPLSMAVGFAMIASFILSQTLVPVLSNLLLKKFTVQKSMSRIDGYKKSLVRAIEKADGSKKIWIPFTILILLLFVFIAFKNTGTEIFPRTDAGQLQVRLRMPTGTRIERTEDATKQILFMADSIAGKGKVSITSAFVGLQPPTYAINPIYLFTSGPQESVIKINFTKSSGIKTEGFKESLRSVIAKQIPGAALSFEPADLVTQVLSLGADNPIEIVVQGKNLAQSRSIADKLSENLHSVSYLRDIQIAQPFDYPTIQINYDRIRTGQSGLTISKAGKSVLEGTSSSRLTEPVYWLDNASGNSYQVQVEYPQLVMNSPEQMEELPVGKSGDQMIYLRDIAEWKKGTSIGEYDRMNQQRFITVTANIHEKDLGTAVSDVNKNISKLGVMPSGVRVYLRGQPVVLHDTQLELSTGLLLAIFIILLMLTAFFQSIRLSLVVISIVPGILAGSLLLLLVTGNTMNIQSFMGCIMAVGIGISNAVLLITNAQSLRSKSSATLVGAQAASNRLRPVLMTSLAMISGMIPMSLSLGEGGHQTAPLGIAVIGGLLFSTCFCLFVLPGVYDWAIGNKSVSFVSFDPTDENSTYYEKQS
ncbi:MAG TPA: efflux RND transporter permease subunit, partial [Puia sp.]|nr:efflux RND transporter permease subunit [Puia sp.]